MSTKPVCGDSVVIDGKQFICKEDLGHETQHRAAFGIAKWGLARRGSKRLTILRLLRSKPAHCYALAKYFGVKSPTMHEHLGNLMRDGLIEVGKIEGVGKRKRKMYQLTEKGRAMLK